MAKSFALAIYLLISVLLTGNLACSQEPDHGLSVPTHPVATYKRITQRALVACTEGDPFSQSTSLLQHIPENSRACIAKASADSAAKLPAALESVKSPEMRAALKAYHASFLAALQAILPLPLESQEAHRLRYHGSVHKATHAWSQFETMQ